MVSKFTLYLLLIGITLSLNYSEVSAQLDNADWDNNDAACVTDALLYPGVAVITCGVIADQAANQRYVIAYIGMNAGPGTSRSEITNTDSTLHHTDWLVSNIGNVFGTAIKESTAEVFVTASSNYGSVFGVGASASTSILNYGSISSPASTTEAAGRIYRLDPITGAATVFATLPQQSTTLEHWDCERDNQDLDRTNTGVGLGNIVYDEINDQFFVSNVEDGRIYRLNSSGTILDSYDPGTLDNNAAGITDLEDIPYGLAVEPGSNRLFYGLVDEGTDANSNTALAGAPAIYSIDLNANGGWASTTTNNTSPSTYSWDNYTGSEQFHTTIATGSGDTYTQWTTYFISDLAFDPEGNLLVGVRVGCYGSWHSSYNHWGETDLVALNTSNNLYNSTPFEYDISVTGDGGNDDSYGGVAVYDKRNTDCDVWYLSSSADVLAELGPHGIAVWDSETTNAPVSPLGVFSYGVLPNGDPKGIGGDIEIYNGCKATCSLTGPTTVCPGEILTYSFTPTCTTSSIIWTVSGDAAIQGANDGTSISILAGSNNFTVSLNANSVEQPCTATVTVSTPPTVSLNSPTLCSGFNATVTVSASGGVTPYSYVWTVPGAASNPGNTASFSTGIAGTYAVTVTDNEGCTGNSSTTLTTSTVPDLSTTNTAICSGGSIDLSTLVTDNASTSGTLTYHTAYPTNSGNQLGSSTVNPISTTEYYVFKDTGDCSDTDSLTITVDPLPILTTLTDEAICNGDAFTTANITTSITNSVPVTYQWYNNNGTDNSGTAAIGGETTAILSTLPTAVGSYSYRVEAVSSDNTSCSASQTVNLTIHAVPTVAVADVLRCTSNAETITATASGGTPAYSYAWNGPYISNPGDVANFSASVAGIYTVTITDANTCTATASGELTFQAPICLPTSFTIRRGERN